MQALIPGRLPLQTNQPWQIPLIRSTPYSSNKSVGGHVLSLPSTLFYWTTRPVGFTLKKAEKNLPRLFQGERGNYGVFPLFELGGDTGFSYGLLLFHNRPFYPNHSAKIEALFSSSDYNNIDFDYTIERFLSDRGRLEIDAVPLPTGRTEPFFPVTMLTLMTAVFTIAKILKQP